ncbi:MAG: GDP-mannose 4,6-dehydratase [Thermodesulfovibrionales bacterium]|nr:GDP-mannose 4,6-dehydratase [Thermodesulfovibrionales bacterium]
MKTILVTGCSGFIGHKVSELLLEQDYSVVGIDNLNDYYDVRLKSWRLNQLFNNAKAKNFTFYKISITDLNSIRHILSRHYIDAIINLAACVGVRASLSDPWTYLDTNIKGTLNLLEATKDYKIEKFVLASTSSIYGNNQKLPFNVSDKTDSCLTPYSATKKSAELLSYSYHYLYGINITIPRYFTVYGPASRPDMAIFNFIKNIDCGKIIYVYGDGTQKRDFTFISDAALGTIKALKKTGFEIINIGNDHPVELNYVIKLIEDALGKKAIIQYISPHKADMKDTWADINYTKKAIHWKPSTSIEEGIAKTVKWHIENRELVNSLN